MKNSSSKHLNLRKTPYFCVFSNIAEILYFLTKCRNERIIAAIIPAVNVVQEQFHDHSSSQTQRDFIQSKRECMGSFVGVDDESDEDENIV